MLDLKKPIIIGALHLPRYGRCNPKTTMAYLEDYVVQNCRVFVENGLETLYIQDENPAPGKATEETIAVVSALGRLLKREFPKLRLGVIVEAHDGVAPIAIAHACGADFVRIKVFAGAMVKAAGIQNACGIEAVQYRTMINSDVTIFA
ncbi:MAG: phosphoric monoester hydrolase, partial [Planctomycetes bacterium]|nr:phosphoric monoester hydrolase [Planctomycetota bacterium]